MKKRVLSTLLALLFAVSLVPAMSGTARADNELQNVNLSPEGVLSWDAYPDADKYYFTITHTNVEDPEQDKIRDEIYQKEQSTFSLDLIDLCRERGCSSGTYSVSVYASQLNPNGGHMEIPLTSEWKGTFVYNPAKTLPTPQNLRWDGDLAKWDAVEGAEFYIVCLYLHETQRYSEKKVMAPQTYQSFTTGKNDDPVFTVKAISKDKDTGASEVARSELAPDPERPAYPVTVDGGKADKSTCRYQGKVFITADTPPDGQHFYCWEVVSGNVTLLYTGSPNTSFTMGNEAAHIKAVFKDNDNYKFLSYSYEPKDTLTVGDPLTIHFQLNIEANYVEIEYDSENAGWLPKSTLAYDAKEETVVYDTSWETPGTTVTYRLAARDGFSKGVSEPFTVTYKDGASSSATYTIVYSSQRVWDSPWESVEERGDWLVDLPAGTEVTVVDTQGNWSKIILEDGYGWVESAYLVPKSDVLNPFTDVTDRDKYYPAVLWAYHADPQVTKGVSDTKFGPAETVTRGQCVTFLWRSMGCPEPKTTKNPFVDVKASEYWYKPILWAVENGITVGVDSTHFAPKATLSTRHIVTFLYRTVNPGKGGPNGGWNGEAAAWAAEQSGNVNMPFYVEISVNDKTPCPRWCVVQFLWKVKFMERS